MDLNFPEIPAATQALVDMVARLDQTSTAGDVAKIVDAAGEALDDKEDGSTFPEEIKALLEQEEAWKGMAVRKDGRLREVVKKGLERYGGCIFFPAVLVDSELICLARCYSHRRCRGGGGQGDGVVGSGVSWACSNRGVVSRRDWSGGFRVMVHSRGTTLQGQAWWKRILVDWLASERSSA